MKIRTRDVFVAILACAAGLLLGAMWKPAPVRAAGGYLSISALSEDFAYVVTSEGKVQWCSISELRMRCADVQPRP